MLPLRLPAFAGRRERDSHGLALWPERHDRLVPLRAVVHFAGKASCSDGALAAGQPLLTRRASPILPPQLGDLAPTHDFQARQTLLGGYYELINKTTVSPNPDFWTALICAPQRRGSRQRLPLLRLT